MQIKSCTMNETINTVIEYLPHAGHGAKNASCSFLLKSYDVDPVIFIPILQMRDRGLERPVHILRVLKLGNGKSVLQQGRKRQLSLDEAGKISRSRKSPGSALKNELGGL